MSEIVIYHNPRCSKSRETLALLHAKGIQPSVVEYLNSTPTAAQLAEIQTQLGFASARDFMRTKEDEYKALDLKNVTDETVLLEAMASHPKLIERPIVIKDGKAKLGRPPEQVLELF